MQEFEFVDNRKVFWFLGGLVLVVGLLAALLIAPIVRHPPNIGGPDIRLPRMGVVPPQDAPKMSVQVKREPELHP